MTHATPSPSASRDVFGRVDELDGASLRNVIARLELRGRDPIFAAWRDAYLDRLPLPPGAAVLDLGCGTAVVARALARRPGFSGRIAAVDRSAALLDAAGRFATDEGLAGTIELLQADAEDVPLPGGTFDAVVAHTLVSHVPDPAAVLREAARLLGPGGRLAVFDGDYASLTFAHPDPALARAVEEGLVAVLAEQPRVMRDLPALLVAAGLRLEHSVSHAFADVGTGGFFLSMAEAFGPLVARAGILPARRVGTWLAGLREASESGTFFGACNYYTYVTLAAPRPRR